MHKEIFENIDNDTDAVHMALASNYTWTAFDKERERLLLEQQFVKQTQTAALKALAIENN